MWQLVAAAALHCTVATPGSQEGNPTWWLCWTALSLDCMPHALLPCAFQVMHACSAQPLQTPSTALSWLFAMKVTVVSLHWRATRQLRKDLNEWERMNECCMHNSMLRTPKLVRATVCPSCMQLGILYLLLMACRQDLHTIPSDNAHMIFFRTNWHTGTNRFKSWEPN